MSMFRMFDAANAFSQNLGRWYIVDTTTSVTTMLATQNAVLTAHSPSYALVSGDGDTNNGLFQISDSTLIPTGFYQPSGTYELRVGGEIYKYLRHQHKKYRKCYGNIDKHHSCLG
ncbi:MAG: hypothetical protein HFP78_00095 [Methylococcales symbiont of Hymedesmia sp. n. MRB-2018]|nr:MAG: hypothetical protein HFP78_00095 [Methylococcales symbiont of Hymedesmia sp. n. MRB-2018]